MVSIVGAQEVRSEGRPSRTSVLQALIGRKFTTQKLKNPGKSAFSGVFLCSFFIKYDWFSSSFPLTIDRFAKLIIPRKHKAYVKQEVFGAIGTAKDWLLLPG